MITDIQKESIAKAVVEAKSNIGSWKKLAVSVGVNEATLSHTMQKPERWHYVSEKMWRTVAAAIGHRVLGTYWQLTDTVNTDLMQAYLQRAQFHCMFMAISHSAGQGKSTGVEMYRQGAENVYYLEAAESWTHKVFVTKLAEVLGVPAPSYRRLADLTDDIVITLKSACAKRNPPLLIVDEANKLRASSLRLFIPLFNRLQAEIGMVLIGAHDLKKIIQLGVRRDQKGFDELESRLGRTYWSLAGIFKKDVTAICIANGVDDQDTINRIWRRMIPQKQMIDGKYEMVAKNDLRVLTAAIKHERAQAELNAERVEKRPALTEMETVMGGELVEA